MISITTLLAYSVDPFLLIIMECDKNPYFRVFAAVAMAVAVLYGFVTSIDSKIKSRRKSKADSSISSIEETI